MLVRVGLCHILPCNIDVDVFFFYNLDLIFSQMILRIPTMIVYCKFPRSSSIRLSFLVRALLIWSISGLSGLVV